MGERSVMAFVGLGNDHREHLALGPGERGVAERDSLVELYHAVQCRWVLTLHAKNIVDPPPQATSPFPVRRAFAVSDGWEDSMRWTSRPSAA